MASGARKRVMVVTGGGRGIGAAIAEELGRNDAFVVTMDPMFALDGSRGSDGTEEATADRIVKAGGAARASDVSVTDEKAVRALFAELVDEFGSIDAVINPAGNSRPTDFTSGSEEDWESVVSVHLGGYLNLLQAALPLMAEAGHGRVLGVTSGSGWRPTNGGAYSCAKRAVAVLTQQIGRAAPSGVTINALSPMAVTRMVTSALSRSPAPQVSGPTTGGMVLGVDVMPPPENLAPIGSYLASEQFSWCSGQIIYSNGAEVALVSPRRLIEVVRARDVTSLAHVLDRVTPIAFSPAEAHQTTNGATNPRFGPIFDETLGQSAATAVRSCLVVTDDPGWLSTVGAVLAPRGVTVLDVRAGSGEIAKGFQAAAEQVAQAARQTPIDAIVLALAGAAPAATDPGTSEWQRILDEHAGITAGIVTDAGWVRAAADYSASADRPVRVVTITDATSSAGRTRAQVAAQLARGSKPATSGRMAAFSISVETPHQSERGPVAELAAHLLCGETSTLSGAEFAAGSGWLGLRSHPNPAGSISFGGPAIPEWLDSTLRQLITEHTA